MRSFGQRGPGCKYPLGMESGAILDDSITASSFWDKNFDAYRGRLNGVAGAGAWAAETNTIGEWLQVDLGEKKRVTGTIIQGRYRNHDQWVTSYKLQYSVDGRRWVTCDGSKNGHPGPCGPGKCQYERGKGASDSDAYFSRLKDTVRHLRKESKVDEIARRVWSESTSDESEDVLTPRPRSLPVKTADLSPGRVDGNQARHARAYSEPPEVPRLKSAFTSGQESPATSKTSKKKSDSEQYTVRDLRASKKLVREVDQVLDGLLEPTSRARGKIAEKRGNHRSSSTSSCGSNSSASSEEDRPHRARSTRNTDRNTPVTNLLDSPIDARYVRFLPQSWKTHMSMRVEVLGCSLNGTLPLATIHSGNWDIGTFGTSHRVKAEGSGADVRASQRGFCKYPLGMESGTIPDDSITASSFWGDNLETYRGRLNGVTGGGAWAAETNTIGEWLQVDLGEKKRVTGTIIQGRNRDYPQWVTSYKLQYSVDGRRWVTCDGSKNFPGNTDRNTPVTNLLDSPIGARYVRFLPQTWKTHMSMRVEVLGCSLNGVLKEFVPLKKNRSVHLTLERALSKL
ncbi:hypothetical protein Bbelb_053660 [Branchiostoma belcheri]|nr:hypothetical protein Bbelb_053660 [Branchiostoma belcheri]